MMSQETLFDLRENCF